MQPRTVTRDIVFSSFQSEPEVDSFIRSITANYFLGVYEQRVHVDRFHDDLKLASGDTSKVEQVIDEARFQLNVALHHGELTPHIRRQTLLVTQNSCSHQNRCKRGS